MCERLAQLLDVVYRQQDTDIARVMGYANTSTLYRITQEALRNIAKHAGRTHAKVTLEGSDSRLRLEVADFGEGFDTHQSRAGLGLISMEERARLVHGKFAVESALGKGTTVGVQVPLQASQTESQESHKDGATGGHSV